MTSLRVTAAAMLSLLAVVHSAPASAQTTNGGFASATVSAVSIEDGASAVIFPPILTPRTESIPRTTTDFAATFGGGGSFLAGDHWSFDVDARYIGVFGERDAQIGRYGGGITYRF